MGSISSQECLLLHVTLNNCLACMLGIVQHVAHPICCVPGLIALLSQVYHILICCWIVMFVAMFDAI